MKKFLGIVVLGLLWCNTSFADSLRVVDGDTKQTVQPITVVDYVKELGIYAEPTQYPSGMMEFLKSNCINENFFCISKKATKKMAQLFKRGPSYHARHPGEMLYAMALFEIFYLKKIKESERKIDKFLDNWPIKSVQKSTIISVLKLNVARKKMRNALGMSLNISAEEAMERFWIIGNFLEQGEVKKKKINDGVKKRRILLAKYQKTISDFKSSLENKEEEIYKKINPKYKSKKK